MSYFLKERQTIMNQMAMIPLKNPSSDLNSPGGDVVDQFPLF